MTTPPEYESCSQGAEFDQGLEKSLKRLFEPGIETPSAVDRAVLAHARAALSTAPPRVAGRISWRWAAAAAVVVAGAGIYSSLFRGSLRTTAPGQLSADIDGDGITDIVDAMVLARRVHDGGHVDGLPDVNGDGAVDAQDADALARRAVRLTGGST